MATVPSPHPLSRRAVALAPAGGRGIPDALVVAEDVAPDAARFERSDNGVVPITRPMPARL